MGGVEKAFLDVLGRPLVTYSIEVFQRAPEIDVICLVVSAGSVERAKVLASANGWHKVSEIVPGGKERQHSVRAGLDALPDAEWLLVHDAARPLVTAELVKRGLKSAHDTGAAVAAIPVRDTLKRARDEVLLVAETVDRRGLWAAQTPQVFRADVLRAAFAAAGHREFTDDASLVEANGVPVCLFMGSVCNVKLTHQEDLPLVEALLRQAIPEAPS
jgi:2-C-methyl-D-erythritol 4-phosphate cytidylyltransferase